MLSRRNTSANLTEEKDTQEENTREEIPAVFKSPILNPTFKHEYIENYLNKDVRNHLKKLPKNKRVVELAKMYIQIAEEYKVSQIILQEEQNKVERLRIIMNRVDNIIDEE